MACVRRTGRSRLSRSAGATMPPQLVLEHPCNALPGYPPGTRQARCAGLTRSQAQQKAQVVETRSGVETESALACAEGAPVPRDFSADSRSTTFIKGLAARELALETAGFLVSRESGARAIRSPRPCLCLVRLVAEIFDICFVVCRYAGFPCPADCSSVAHRDDKILGVLPDGSRLKYELLPYRVISL